MDEIRIMEKPEWISWDDIHELLFAAHKKNREKGINMLTAEMSGEELEKKMGDNGKCFVALCGDKLVGTTSVCFYKGSAWYERGQLVAYCMLSAILPKYQGIGINEDLVKLRNAYISHMGAKILHGNTAEDNKIVRMNAKRNGFTEVRIVAPPAIDHYSVIFVKWLDGCPFSERLISRKLKLSEKITKAQYKVGMIERSFILSFFCKVIRRIFDV